MNSSVRYGAVGRKGSAREQESCLVADKISIKLV
jgi:hypothetical protein